MDGVVGQLCRGDEKLWVEQIWVAVVEVLRRHRVHVMDVKTRRDVVSLDSEVAVVISDQNDAANALPLIRTVEALVVLTLEAESDVSDPPMKG